MSRKIKQIDNNSSKPSFTGRFSYRDEKTTRHIDYEWHDIPSKEKIPDLAWHQVYIVGNLDGMVPLVKYQDGPDNLPGGRTETDESVEDTAEREALEELNCRIITWEPLGYQSNYENGHFFNHQIRIYAKLEKIGEFELDPGGLVIGQRYIKIHQLADVLNWPKTAQRLQELAIKYF